MSVTHIAGIDVAIDIDGEQIYRQRCSWCGDLILDTVLDSGVGAVTETPHPINALIRILDIGDFEIVSKQGEEINIEAAAPDGCFFSA